MVKNLIFCKSFENLNFYRKSMPQLHDFKSTRLRKYYSLNLKKNCIQNIQTRYFQHQSAKSLYQKVGTIKKWFIPRPINPFKRSTEPEQKDVRPSLRKKNTNDTLKKPQTNSKRNPSHIPFSETYFSKQTSNFSEKTPRKRHPNSTVPPSRQPPFPPPTYPSIKGDKSIRHFGNRVSRFRICRDLVSRIMAVTSTDNEWERHGAADTSLGYCNRNRVSLLTWTCLCV